MTQKERTKLHIAHCLIAGKMFISEAAEALDLSERQVKRIKKGVIENGDAFVIHKNKGRKPSHAISDKTKKIVVELKNTEKYLRANFSHFQEILEEHEHIIISKPTVYRILDSGGLVSPKKHTRKRLHHRRKRKPQRGMLAIADASPHHWFFDDREFSLHGAVDDATSEILSLFFTPNECMEGYFQVIRDIVCNNGIPLSLYVDRHTIFRSPNTDKLTLQDELEGKKVKDTHFGRAMRELGINLIYAKSPQAKGRIERLWETLQSRLPIEFGIAGIKTIEEANAFLSKFIEKYNQKFAVAPKETSTSFRQLSTDLNIDYILCIKEERRVDNGSCFSYGNNYYKVIRNAKTMPIIPKAKITVLKSTKIGLMVQYSGTTYETEMLEEKPKKEQAIINESKQVSKSAIPSNEHPWKTKPKQKVASFMESDREVLEALYSSRQAWR